MYNLEADFVSDRGLSSVSHRESDVPTSIADLFPRDKTLPDPTLTAPKTAHVATAVMRKFA